MAMICPVCNAPLSDGEISCPACGFKLLERTQAFAPIAVPATAGNAARAIPEECTLSIVKGPQVGNVFRLAADTVTLGRSPRCDIFLNDMTVSRLHATLRQDGEGYQIMDEDSFNGLWVNNRNVKNAKLADGDTVQIGTFCLVYHSMPSVQ